MSESVVVVGAGGRMGRFATALVDRSNDFELAATVGSSDDLASVLADVKPRLALDLTRAGLGHAHACVALEAGARPVIGTSGVTPDEVRDLDGRARALDLGGIVVPNFSLGVALLGEMAERAARWFPDVEVLEYHHDGKADAPSATALDTARRIAAARPDGVPSRAAEEGDDDPSRGRSVDGVHVHAVRLPGLMAHQEVVFGADGERLTVRHDVVSQEAYGPGILIALAHAMFATGVAHGLGAALFEARP